MEDSKTTWIVLVFVVVFLFLSGDNNNVEPDPVSESVSEIAARQYLKGIADVFEEAASKLDSDPDQVSQIGLEVKSKTKSVRESSDDEMSRMLDESIESASKTAALYRKFAEGYREVAK